MRSKTFIFLAHRAIGRDKLFMLTHSISLLQCWIRLVEEGALEFLKLIHLLLELLLMLNEVWLGLQESLLVLLILLVVLVVLVNELLILWIGWIWWDRGGHETGDWLLGVGNVFTKLLVILGVHLGTHKEVEICHKQKLDFKKVDFIRSNTTNAGIIFVVVVLIVEEFCGKHDCGDKDTMHV